MKKWLFGTLIGLGSATLVAGTTLGIGIPIILKLKKGINNFIPSGNHHWRNLQKKAESKGLDYVALGDSETAGYNDEMGCDYLSFADFFANDMKNANILNSYTNFAVSGATIQDLSKRVNLNPAIISKLNTSDLITITIGANDLLAYAKLFDAKFGTSLSEILGFGGGTPNHGRDPISPSGNANDPLTPDERWKLLQNTFVEASKSFRTNNFLGLVGLQEKLKDVIFEEIQRNMLTLLADLGKIAPNADIIVIGHAFPFSNLPKSAIDPKIPDIQMSVRDGFNRMLDSLKQAVNMTPYAKFVNFNTDIPAYDNDKSPQLNQDSSLSSPVDPKSPYFRYRKLPNIAGIHPSTYGHQLLGNGLFKLEATRLFGITSNISKYYTMGWDPTDPTIWKNILNDPASDKGQKPLPQHFEFYDQTKWTHLSADWLGSTMLKKNSTHNIVGELFSILNPKIIDNIPQYKQPTTSYTLLESNNGFKIKANGKQGDDTIQTIFNGLFGDQINLEDFNLQTLTSMIHVLGNNTNFMKFISLAFVVIDQIMKKNNVTGGQDTLTYISNIMKDYKTKNALTDKQASNFETIINSAIKNNDNYINYQSTKIENTDIKNTFGVNNFGELLKKYNTHNTIGLIQDIPLFVTPLLEQYLSNSISINNGNDFIDMVKAMGYPTVANNYLNMINKDRNTAKNYSKKQDIINDKNNLLRMVDQLNFSINEMNGTNPNIEKNNVWFQTSNRQVGEVTPYLSSLLKKLSKNSKYWNSYVSSIGWKIRDRNYLWCDCKKNIKTKFWIYSYK